MIGIFIGAVRAQRVGVEFVRAESECWQCVIWASERDREEVLMELASLVAEEGACLKQERRWPGCARGG